MQWIRGVAVGAISVVLLVLWTNWGRAFQLAMAITLLSVLVALLRYPAALTFFFGFLLLAGITVFIPGLTSAFMVFSLALLLARKLIAGDLSWRMPAFLLSVALFALWFQLSGLWVDQLNNYNWILVYRVLFSILILYELVKTREDVVVFMLGAATGMIVTGVSALVSAYRFYTSGAAEQIAGAVANIEKARFYGHWIDPNIMGITIVAFLGVTVALWRSADEAWYIRWYMAAASLLTVITAFVSLSRGAMVGCMIVIVMMLAVERRRAALFTAFAAVVWLVLLVAPIDIIGRIASLATGDSSVTERASLIRAGLIMFQDSPIWGGGLGSYEHNVLYLLKYLPLAFFSHNTYIDILVDGGLIGLGLFGICIYMVIRSLNWRDWNAGKRDGMQSLNAGLRASVVATLFMLLTMSMIAYLSTWVLFALAATHRLIEADERRSVESGAGSSYAIQVA